MIFIIICIILIILYYNICNYCNKETLLIGASKNCNDYPNNEITPDDCTCNNMKKVRYLNGWGCKCIPNIHDLDKNNSKNNYAVDENTQNEKNLFFDAKN